MSFHDAATPEDLPPEMQGDLEPEDDGGATEEERSDCGRFEDSKRYRDELIDAGRRHLVIR